MNIFITGATGFLGSHLAEALVKKGENVTLLLRKTSNLRWLNNLKVNIVYGDLNDINDDVKYTLSKTEFLFHVAGVTNAKRKEDYFRVNVVGTESIVKACYENCSNLKKFILVSSLAAQGPSLNDKLADENNHSKPIGIYGESKLEGEKVTLKYKDKMNIVIIRPGGIYGPRDNSFLEVFKLAQKGYLISPGFNKKLVNIAYVSDIVDGILASSEKETISGDVFLLGDKINYRWEEITKIFSKIFNRKVRMIKIPKKLAYIGVQLSEIISNLKGSTPPLSVTRMSELSHDNWGFDISKAKLILGYNPKIDLEKGFELTLSWYKNMGWL